MILTLRSLSNHPPRILQRHGEMPSVPVGFQTAGLHKRLRFETGARKWETFFPVTAWGLDHHPILKLQLIKDDCIKIQFICQPENADLIHNLASIPHTTPV